MEIVGRRPGEKLHEVMVSEDDAANTLEYDDFYAILPTVRNWNQDQVRDNNGGRPCPEGFRYSSETNTRWLTVAELEQIIGPSKAALD
jgi:UDP-N-acetylglucosamine 4,6-dehydratase